MRDYTDMTLAQAKEFIDQQDALIEGYKADLTSLKDALSREREDWAKRRFDANAEIERVRKEFQAYREGQPKNIEWKSIAEALFQYAMSSGKFDLSDLKKILDIAKSMEDT